MLEYPSLRGRYVSLEPLTPEHIDDLVLAAADRSTFGFTHVPADRESMAQYVHTLRANREAGRDLPFVQRAMGVAGSPIVGCTRFMDLRFQLGRSDERGPLPDEVEIGGTWLSTAAQRTGVNTEAKLLLLTHAFDVWRVQRVAICTDERNQQSRRAIERIGARFEGVLRRHRPSTAAGEAGQLRNTAVHSITVDEWPTVRTLLADLLH